MTASTAVSYTHLDVYKRQALVRAAGVFLRPLAYLNPLDEQPQQRRRQLVDGGVLLLSLIHISLKEIYLSHRVINISL